MYFNVSYVSQFEIALVDHFKKNIWVIKEVAY